MKTFDRKIADYSHPSLITFFISTLNFGYNVTKKVSSNTTPNIGFQEIDTKAGSNDCLIQVAKVVTFDFVFQTSRNGRNENDENKNN